MELRAFLRMERITAEAKTEGHDLGNIARRIDGARPSRAGAATGAGKKPGQRADLPAE
jgi:hypothetical protein